jgi:hypothetical protein
MRKLFLAGALALAIAPVASASVAQAPSAEALAKKSCKAQKAELGTKVLKQTYNAKTVAKAAVEEETDAVVTAAATCKTMKADDSATFESTYGTRKNAFGKCVSAHARAQDDES